MATAVEEQAATTGEMTRNLGEANRATTDIAQQVAGVVDSARSVSSGADDTRRAATELAKLACEQRELVATMRV